MNTTKNNTAGIAEISGFHMAATAADIRGQGTDRLDMALIRNTGPDFTAAAVFTRNDIKAAPVRQGIETLNTNGGQLQAVLVNSGNANACTGPEGFEDNRSLMDELARQLDIASDRVLIASTGRIGRRLPIDRMMASIPTLVKSLSNNPEAGHGASRAILTSDTRPKTVTVQVDPGGHKITIGGMAKGAGMIQPDMATMLAFFATDARLDPALASELLKEVCQSTFNSITVDGDMSTNDTVLLLANGSSGVAIEKSDGAAYTPFKEALHAACHSMADAIVGDGEKISHVIELTVKGAPTPHAAESVARAIGNSLLVKSSWYGMDPNWGRIIDAAGYARTGIREEWIDLYYDNCPVMIQGRECPENREQWKEIVKKTRFSISLGLNQGNSQFKLLTTDLTEAYVNFNKSE